VKTTLRSLLLLAFGLSACVVVIYAGVRFRLIQHMQQQVHTLEAQPIRPDASVVSVDLLKKKFPQHVDVSSFIEVLYRLSQRSGLENVDISTINDGKTKPVPTNTTGKASPAQLLTTHQVRISCEGRYRAIAQYLAEINNIERYSRVVSFDMKPSAHSIKANIVIEITSIEVHNAS